MVISSIVACFIVYSFFGEIIANGHKTEGNELSLPKNFSIEVRTIDDKRLKIEVSPLESIADVKFKIQQITGIGCKDLFLAFQRKVLRDEISLQEYNVSENDQLRLIPGVRGYMPIKIRTFDNKTFILDDIQPTHALHSVKWKIYRKTDIVPEQQRLVFNGIEMENDSYPIIDYNVTKDSILMLTEMRINILLRNRTIMVIDVDPRADVRGFRLSVAEKMQSQGYPGQWFLLHKGRLLLVGPFWRYQVCHNDIVELLHPDERPLITIPFFNVPEIGIGRLLRITPMHTVQDVKLDIEKFFNVSANLQRLVHNGVTLEDGKALQEYRIDNFSWIEVLH